MRLHRRLRTPKLPGGLLRSLDTTSSVDVVLDGGMYLPREAIVPASGVARGEESMTLTDRQRQVLALVAQGHSNKVISRELGDISPATVKEHLEAIFRLLGVRTRAHAV